MKIIFLSCLCFCFIISSNSRLIEKITDRTLTTETKTGSNPPVRLARQADDYALTGISIEDNIHNDEFVRTHNKEAKYLRFFESNSDLHVLPRRARDSSEYQDNSFQATSFPISSSVVNVRSNSKIGLSPSARLTRQTDDDALIDISKEDNMHSDEFVRAYNKEAKHIRFFESKSDPHYFARRPRGSNENQDKYSNATTHPVTLSAANVRPNSKSSLVKKPIPKFNEMEYDDDFQMKVSRSPVKVLDSGEHEDEDFNLDDYDFDVNHDEFVGRGKPLEPRIKHKNHFTQAPKSEPKLHVTPEIKIKSKVSIPTSSKASHKKERSVEVPKKREGEKEDYYDDATTTGKPTEKPRDPDEDFNDDNDESKEIESKSQNIRQVRSSMLINVFPERFEEKVRSKILSILPMFPEMPNDNKSYNVKNKHKLVANN